MPVWPIHTNARADRAHRRLRRGHRRTDRREHHVRARHGVILGTGGFEWDPVPIRHSCVARCTARSRRHTTPATGCGWRWRTARILPIWAKPGGCRSCGFRATPSTASSAAVACGWNAPAPEASWSTRPGDGSSTRPVTTTRWRAHSTTSIPAAATSMTARGSCSTQFTCSAMAFSVSPPGSRCRTGSASRPI